jgi:hypothetical protein
VGSGGCRAAREVATGQRRLAPVANILITGASDGLGRALAGELDTFWGGGLFRVHCEALGDRRACVSSGVLVACGTAMVVGLTR